MKRPVMIAAAAGAAMLSTLVACSSSGSAGDSKTVTVAYEKFGAFVQMDQLMKRVAAEYEKANPGMSVKLEPIEADENDYYTKLDLMNRSSTTAPDVLYEDTFLVNSDISAGFLAPLDKDLAGWKGWSQFSSSAQKAGVGQDGRTYGVPMGTDTRGLWYNKQIFAKAGLPTNWQPKSWADILSAARTIKAKVPGVIPINVYSGKGAGEGSTMQGFEMLLYGTKNPLYDSTSKKWVVSSPGMTDSMDFIKTIFDQKLAPSPQEALDPQWGTKVTTQLLPAGKLAIDLDGSWQSSTWKKTGAKPWPAFSKVLGEAAMPTQNGASPGRTSMSGGWLLSVGSASPNKAAAFKFITMALNKKNSEAYDIAASQIAERKDVADDPAYRNSDPTAPFFTHLVTYTHYRPAYTVYPKISDAIQVAMESVMTDQSSVSGALSQYADTVKGLVGADHAETD